MNHNRPLRDMHVVVNAVEVNGILVTEPGRGVITVWVGPEAGPGISRYF
jgi:hypothetical protein